MNLFAEKAIFIFKFFLTANAGGRLQLKMCCWKKMRIFAVNRWRLRASGWLWCGWGFTRTLGGKDDSPMWQIKYPISGQETDFFTQ